uniref:Laminin G domain-containing protein n=1 Tax=Denticeps clupeoides TaxID=299321 RepID=A0AAY4E7E7_9TELE
HMLLISILCANLATSSFYGDGYVQLRTVESSVRMSLHVRFLTYCDSGLIFLAAGENDFCLVELHSGRIQVMFNFGSGERILRSEKGIQLNDLAWHSMEILHDQHNISLTIDKHLHTSARVPGPDVEFSVQEGLFVGGLGDLDQGFLPKQHVAVGFRGCLDEVLFNQHNLLSSLRSYSGYKTVHEVSLGCNSQFFAIEEDPISFFSSRAYLLLPVWDVPQHGVFECELHGSATDGIVLYASTGQGDFVAMELREGHLVAVIGRGASKTELQTTWSGHEKSWYLVKLHLSPWSVNLTVGEDAINSSLGTHTAALQLGGHLFLGGVNSDLRVEARKNGLLSLAEKDMGGGSFKGCLRNIRVNTLKMGLPNALSSKDISVDCEQDSEPFNTLGPMAPSSDNLSSSDFFGEENNREQSFLMLRDLLVLEGGRALLEPKHMKVNPNFQKLDIQPSHIMFRIEEQPVHGELRLDVDPDQEGKTFSMLDLWHGRVMYVHGGSEDPLDFFMFSVFTSSKRQLPAPLKGNKLHRFNISVVAINDAPELSLPEGNLFVLLENSKRQLNTDILRVTDPDSNVTDLVFSLVSNTSVDAGFLEVEEHPGHPVASFPFLNLEQGKVSFVHKGTKNSSVALRVSDGEKLSNTVVLRILAMPLEYKVANNTGVEVTQGGAVIISSSHLAVKVNVAKQVLDIRYDIFEPPRYGELQRLHSSGDWKHTGTFSQKLLEKERIRYLSTFQGPHPGNVTDGFKCRVIVGSTSAEELPFVIRVRWIHFKVVKSKMHVEADQVATMTPQDLRAVAKGVRVSESNLHFRLLSLPRKGNLWLRDDLLKINSTFSQKNVTDHHLQYKLLHRVWEDTRDSFSFQIFSKYSHSGSHDFRFIIKGHSDKIILINNGLSIMEGKSKVITKDLLFSETLNIKVVHYTVTRCPRHGQLKLIDPSNSTTSIDNILEFTNQDILEERLIYVHDDSETTQDAFHFISYLPIIKEETAVEGAFNISIQLINDERPIRVVEKVFHVARDSQRLLTLEDLCFHDADTDFHDRDLVYTRRGIPMGELVLANHTSHKLYKFQQKDLEEKRVLFVHRGVSFGRFVLFVSDGKHYTSTLLEVFAQDPFIKIGNNTGLLVQKGHEAVISPTNISITSNLDIRDDREIIYQVFLPPSFGCLYCNGESISTFTQHDVKARHLVYQHDDSKNLVDFFNFTVMVKEHSLNASVAVKVYLDSHQHPAKVLHNNLILAEQGKPTKITKKDLKVSILCAFLHSPQNLQVIFSINLKETPYYGFLRRLVEDDDHYDTNKEEPIHSFSQLDINSGHIQYVHDGSDHRNDSFLLDVTNGITKVRDVRVVVDIIPLYIPLHVSGVTVKEGSSKALTAHIITVNSKYFSGLNLLYQVSKAPNHGHIEHSRIPGVPIPFFTRMQVEQGFVNYVHDGSETVADNFTLIANDTDLQKHSLPCMVLVSVIPVNDEVPRTLFVSQVWVGSVTEITVDDLNAEDTDSSPWSLEFIVTPPTNGYLALKSDPSRPILNFTQAHILQRQLVFIHSGDLSGGFHFQVNDGLNFAPREIFNISARSLVLILERNQALKVFPGASKPITVDDLQVVTNDYNDYTAGNRTITFNITTPPKLGRLARKNQYNSTEEISSFTQSMVCPGFYSFSFTVTSPPAVLQPHAFIIQISYENVGAEQTTVLLSNTGAVVKEGGRVLIDKEKLDASNLLGKLKDHQQQSYEVWYRVRTLPSQGIIVVGEQNLTSENPNFSQSTLDTDGITYVHDDSETLSDRFYFDVWLNPKGRAVQIPLDMNMIVSESFSITVTPVNDHAPVLRTIAPSLRVVQGDTVSLTSENLHVEDRDNLPEEIHYTVISKPNNGYLALKDNLNASILTFTQDDIDRGRVHFVQNGQLTSGVFYFSVTDGFHRPLYKLFNLEVEKITLTIRNSTGVNLKQGQTTVVLTSEHLAAEANRRNVSVSYNVTTQPLHGRLLKGHEPVARFTQEDLQAEKVSYHMTDLTSHRDSFEFTVFTSDNNLTGQIFNITVIPLIHLGDLVRIPNGIAVKLRRNVLDASELAALSNSDPLFEIISPPKHGRLVKFGLGGSSQSVKSFTFRDVVQGRVAIEEKVNITARPGNFTQHRMTSVHHLKDSFEFLLKADHVQPAKGTFVFTIVPYNSVTGKPVNGDGSLQKTKLPPFNRTKNLQSPLNTPSNTRQREIVRPQQNMHDVKPQNRWGNHTENGEINSDIPKTSTGKADSPQKNIPVWTKSMPRPASDPLLIILPLLACLLLIVILIVLILVFRHQREKRAQRNMIQELGGDGPPDPMVPRSPYLGQPERSIAVPSVVVTPVTPACPDSAILQRFQGSALMPAIGPPDSSVLLCSWVPLHHGSTMQEQVPPTNLRQNQYWV